MKRHIKDVHERNVASVHEKKKPNKCSECEAAFYLLKDLKDHVTEVHDGDKQFKCSKCDASFSLEKRLKSHIRVNHSRFK